MKVHGKPIFRKFGRTVAVVLSVAVLSAVLYAAVTSIFEIRTIEVQGSNVSVTVDREKLASNLLFFSVSKTKADLLASNPLLENVEFRKKFPHTLVIIVTTRTPVARLQTKDRSLLLDKSGIVVGENTTTVLPLIVFDAPQTSLGAALTDQRILQSLRFVSAARDRLDVASVTAFDSVSLRAKVDKTDIIFAQDGDMSQLVSTLQTLLTGFRIKGTLPKVIDLRFDKPVVTF